MTNEEWLGTVSKENAIEFCRRFCDSCHHMRSCEDCYDEWAKQEHTDTTTTIIEIEIRQNKDSEVKIPFVLSDIQETLDLMVDEDHGRCSYTLTIK